MYWLERCPLSMVATTKVELMCDRQMFLAAELAQRAAKGSSSESRLLKDQQFKSANIPLCQRQIVLT